MARSCTCGCEREHERRATDRPTAETTVGEVARDPVARAVLASFGLNHCCGAHLSLREGAAAAGVRVDDVLAALSASATTPP